MSLTSIYTKKFFLPNVTLSLSKGTEEVNFIKNFAISKEYFLINCATKNDLDLTKNVVWVCPKCGHTHVGATVDTTCPVCNSEYEIKK